MTTPIAVLGGHGYSADNLFVSPGPMEYAGRLVSRDWMLGAWPGPVVVLTATSTGAAGSVAVTQAQLSGVVAGDVLVAFVTATDPSNTDAFINVPAGWEFLTQVGPGGGVIAEARMYWRAWVSGDGTYTWTEGSGFAPYMTAEVSVVRNADTTLPIPRVTQTNGVGTTVTVSSLPDVPFVNSLLMTGALQVGTTTAYSSFSPFTLGGTTSEANGPSRSVLAWRESGSDGTSLAATLTAGAAGTGWGSITVVISPILGKVKDHRLVFSGGTNVNVMAAQLPRWKAGTVGTIIFWTAISANTQTCLDPTGGGTYIADGNVIGNSSARAYFWHKAIDDTDRLDSLTAVWSGNGAVSSGYWIVKDEEFSAIFLDTGGNESTPDAPVVTAASQPNRAIPLVFGRNGSSAVYTFDDPRPFAGGSMDSGCSTNPTRNVAAFQSHYESTSTAIPEYSMRSNVSGQSTSLLFGAGLYILVPISGLSAIGVDTTLKYNTRAALGDPSSVLYNTRAALGDPSSVLYNTRITLGDSSILSYAVRTTLGDPSIVVYNTRAALGDPSIIRYNTRAAFGEDSILRYAVRTPYGEDSILRYAVRTAVGDPSIIVYNTRAALGDPSSVLYNTQAPLGDSSILRYNVRTSYGEDSILRYAVRAALGDSSTLLYNVRAALGDPSILRYNVRATLGDPSSILYNVRAALGDPSSLLYNVRAALGDSSTVLYNVLVVGLSAIGEDSILRYNTRAALGDSSIIRYNTRTPFGEDSILRYNVRAALGDQSIIRYNTRAPFGEDSILRYNTRAAIGDPSILRYAVRTALGDPSILRYNIRAALGDESILRYNTRAPFGENSVLIWRVRAVLGDSSIIKYNVRAVVLDSSTLLWNVRQVAGDSSTIFWNTLQLGTPVSIYDVWGIVI